MVTLSLCMIVKDEEKTLSRCLNSVTSLVDEIIIVDTGSSDNTKEIAKKFTDRIYEYTWKDDFASARNFSFSKATQDFIMWLDADDIIKQNELIKMIELKKKLTTKTRAIKTKYVLSEKTDECAEIYILRERIVNRRRGYKWRNKIHEYLAIKDEVIFWDVSINHKKEKQKTVRNKNILKTIIYGKEKYENIYNFYYAQELYVGSDYEEAKRYYEMYMDKMENTKEDISQSVIGKYNCLLKLDKREEAIKYLYKIGKSEKVTPQIACYIAVFKAKEKKYKESIEWYTSATKIKNEKDTYYTCSDFCDVIPYLGLVNSYIRLKDYNNAEIYNNKLKKITPNSRQMKFNEDVINILKKINKKR